MPKVASKVVPKVSAIKVVHKAASRVVPKVSATKVVDKAASKGMLKESVAKVVLKAASMVVLKVSATKVEASRAKAVWITAAKVPAMLTRTTRAPRKRKAMMLAGQRADRAFKAHRRVVSKGVAKVATKVATKADPAKCVEVDPPRDGQWTSL